VDGEAGKTRECLLCKGLVVEGVDQVGEEWIRGDTLCSIKKAQRKDFSKEGLSNKSTS
jgi:hypothetical protein